MARAGFYAIHNSSIRFGRDGRWYADGQPITNPRIADLFSRHVQRAEDGTYRLRIADEQATIEIEDTPYVVIAAGETDGVAWIELNDRSREVLDPTSLAVGADEVLYCRVKGGREPARFLRPAYYQIGHLIDAAPGGGFIVRSAGGTHPIGRR
ncbi:MAG: DUF1285 domain-containing protein [Deltaproteobacteria bacterium]|nr:DUF1285 domain-containing protein [Deltaproteobacteria bacterium]